MKIKTSEILMILTLASIILPAVVIANLVPQHILAYFCGVVFGVLAATFVSIAVVRGVMKAIDKSQTYGESE